MNKNNKVKENNNWLSHKKWKNWEVKKKHDKNKNKYK